MKTLENVIAALEHCTKDPSSCANCPNDDPACNIQTYSLYYLKQLHALRSLYAKYPPLTYRANNPSRPILLIDGQYYEVLEYSRKYDGCWRCVKVKPFFDTEQIWFTCDDDNYLLSVDGKFICREVGWDLREERI